MLMIRQYDQRVSLSLVQYIRSHPELSLSHPHPSPTHTPVVPTKKKKCKLMISLPSIILYADRIYWIRNKKNVDRHTYIPTVAENAFFVPLTPYLVLRICVCEIQGGGSLSVFCM